MSKRDIIIPVIAASLVSAICTGAVIHYAGNDVAGGITNNSELFGLQRNLARLEQQLKAERDAREQLQARLFSQQTDAAGVTESSETDSQQLSSVDELLVNDPLSPPQAIDTDWTKNLSPSDYKLRLLTEAGIPEDQAKWIIRTESDAALTALNEQYRARRERIKQLNESGGRSKNTYELLRDQIGDESYERYLEANGWPTSVRIDSVMENSPGQNAGLEPGDSIVAYDNQRIFNVRELNSLTASGDEGESVLIEVDRNGEAVQLTIPRGPIGISSGRGRFGR